VINRFEGGGISIYGSDNKVEGNFIGTDPSGSLDRGNLYEGVYVNGVPTNTIGGSSLAARNLISGNDSAGVHLNGGGGSVVSGNLIGTTKDGVKPLGNSEYGVYISDSDENSVGGTSAASGNTIAFNGYDGVSINGAGGDNDTINNSVLRNSIFSNAGMGIDLDTNGPTPNDVGDADSGTNNFQNYPVLTSATTSAGGTTTIGGTLSSNSFEAFKIQFFSNPSGDEGKRFIGEKTVIIWSSGQVSFTFTPSQAVPAGQNVTATATDSSGNTSEFSIPRTVVAS
jgi:Right handed beta helix region